MRATRQLPHFAPLASVGGAGVVSAVPPRPPRQRNLMPERGITIGRDASSEVVVAQNEVSRRHAEIVPSERGYLIHDHSTNGVYVNGVRVLQSQVLSRSDVVRVGSEEFRFYADVMISGSMPAATTPAPPTAPPTPAPSKDAQATAPALAAVVDTPAPAAPTASAAEEGPTVRAADSTPS